jgi:hypothetical protein
MRKSDPETSTSLDRRRFLAIATAGVPVLALLSCRRNSAKAAAPAIATLRAADFRRPGSTDRQVLEQAFAAWRQRGGRLELEQGHVYDLGTKRDGTNVFELFWLVDATLAGNGATLRIQTEGRIVYNLLYLAYYRNLRIENLRAVDTGFDGTFVQGAKFIVLDTGQRDSVGLTLDNVVGERLVSFIQAQGPPGQARVRGIRIGGNCRAINVFYALNCEDQGDDVRGSFSTINCGRSYFPYGVSGHDLAIQIHHDGAGHGPAAETAVLIKSYGRTTSGIRVDARFSGVLASGGSCVSLEHQHDRRAPPSVIEDVDLRINVEPGTADPNNCHRLVLRSYDPDGILQAGQTRNIWRRITVGGNLRPGRAAAIFSQALPLTPIDLTIAAGTIGAEAGDVSAPGVTLRRLNR